MAQMKVREKLGNYARHHKYEFSGSFSRILRLKVGHFGGFQQIFMNSGSGRGLTRKAYSEEMLSVLDLVRG